MGYESWAEWCGCELDGFNLPAVERREVVAELAESGMSQRSIADVLDVSKKTIQNKLAEVDINYPPEPIVGQDGKPRHVNSTAQIRVHKNVPRELRCMAGVLETAFTSTFDKRCTPTLPTMPPRKCEPPSRASTKSCGC
jgi:hypothetical protein